MRDFTKDGRVGVATRGSREEYIAAAIALEAVLAPVAALDMWVRGELFEPVLRRVIGHLQASWPHEDWAQVDQAPDPADLTMSHSCFVGRHNDCTDVEGNCCDCQCHEHPLAHPVGVEA